MTFTGYRHSRYYGEPGDTTFHKYDVVVVKSGRKVPIGLVGRIFWTGWKNYSGRWVERVGMYELGGDGEAIWTSAYNLRKATPDEAVPTVEAPKTDLVAMARMFDEGYAGAEVVA